MTRTEFMDQIDRQVGEAIAAGFTGTGTDEFLSETILTEIEIHGDRLPESTATMLCGILVVFGIRRREFLASHPAH